MGRPKYYLLLICRLQLLVMIAVGLRSDAALLVAYCLLNGYLRSGGGIRA